MRKPTRCRSVLALLSSSCRLPESLALPPIRPRQPGDITQRRPVTTRRPRGPPPRIQLTKRGRIKPGIQLRTHSIDLSGRLLKRPVQPTQLIGLDQDAHARPPRSTRRWPATGQPDPANPHSTTTATNRSAPHQVPAPSDPAGSPPPNSGSVAPGQTTRSSDPDSTQRYADTPEPSPATPWRPAHSHSEDHAPTDAPDPRLAPPTALAAPPIPARAQPRPAATPPAHNTPPSHQPHQDHQAGLP